MQSIMLKPSDEREYLPARIELPPGACDSHFHLLGPQDLFAQSLRVHGRRPDEYSGVTTIGDWFRYQQAYGFSRGLLVQSTWHDTSYEQVLHALCLAPDRMRAVIRPQFGITDRELEILDEVGVVGIRFQASHGQSVDDEAGRMIRRVHDLGWSAHFVYRPHQLDGWKDQIRNAPGKVVIEHTGYIDVTKGKDSDSYRFLCEMLDTGRAYVKLSSNYSKDHHIRPKMTPPFGDTVELSRSIVEAYTDRVLYGSDWPHSKWNPKPSDATLIDMLLHWAPEEEQRRKILVDNPEAAFGFPKWNEPV